MILKRNILSVFFAIVAIVAIIYQEYIYFSHLDDSIIEGIGVFVNILLFVSIAILLYLTFSRLFTPVIIATRKKVIRALAIFFILWGVLNIVIIVFFIRYIEMNARFYPPNIYIPLYSFLVLISFLAGFGFLFYQKGARTIAVVLSIISSLCLLHGFFRICYVFFLPTGTSRIIGGIHESTYINYFYPDNWELLFVLILIGIFIYAVVIILHSDTKLIFEFTGNIKHLEEGIQQNEVKARRTSLILILIWLVLLLEIAQIPRSLLFIIGRWFQ